MTSLPFTSPPAAKRKSMTLQYLIKYDNPDSLTNTLRIPNVEREKVPLLTELVPFTAWGSNLRDNLTTKEWSLIKDWCYLRAGYRCEICGETGLSQHSRRWNVEAHEIWEYDDVKNAQTLAGLIALCPLCHECKHYGRAMAIGIDLKVRRRLMAINFWNYEETMEHCKESVSTYVGRSKKNWTLDLSWLNKYFGISVTPDRKHIDLSVEQMESINSTSWKTT